MKESAKQLEIITEGLQGTLQTLALIYSLRILRTEKSESIGSLRSELVGKAKQAYTFKAQV